MARNAGVDVNEWVEEAILEYAEDLGVDPKDLTERERLEAIEERVDRMSRIEASPARRESPPAAERRPAERPRVEAAPRRAEAPAPARPRAPEPAAGDLEDVLSEVERRAERNEQRTARAIESLSGLANARGAERGRLDEAISEIERRAAESEERTARALESIAGLVNARSGDRERLQQALAAVEERTEKTAQRTAHALESLTGMVEARKSDRDRLEGAIERIGKRAEENEARTARALEALAQMVNTDAEPSYTPPAPAAREDADPTSERLGALARRAARAPEPPAEARSSRARSLKTETPAPASREDDETFRLVAERLANKRRQRQGLTSAERAPAQREPARETPPPAAPARRETRPVETRARPGARRDMIETADEIDALVRAAQSEADEAVERMERQLSTLVERVERMTNEPARGPEAQPLDDLARRVAAIRGQLDGQDEGPDEAVLAALTHIDAKIERAAATGEQSTASIDQLSSAIGRLEAAVQRPTTVSLDPRPIEELAERIDGVRGLVERQDGLQPKVDRIDAVVGELKQKLIRPAVEIERLETAVAELAQDIQTLGRAPLDHRPVEELSRRIDALRETVEGQGNLSNHVDRLERALNDMRAKLERPTVDAALRQIEAKVDAAVSARPLEEINKRIDAVRNVAERSFAPHVDRLEAQLANINAKLERPTLDSALRKIEAKVDAAADSRPLEEIGKRIDAVRSAAERGFAPHAERLEAAIANISAKLERPQLDNALRNIEAKVDAAVNRPAPDPRPLEELNKRIEAVHAIAERSFAPHAARLEAALANIDAKLDRPIGTADATLNSLSARIEEAMRKSSLDARAVEDLNRRIEAVRNVAERGFTPHAARLESALADIAAKLDSVNFESSTGSLDAELKRLNAKVDQAISRPQPPVTFDPAPIEDLARRIESVRESVAAPTAFGAKVDRLEAALGEMSEKLDRAQPTLDARGINASLAAMNARLEEAFRQPTSVASIDTAPIDALAEQMTSLRESIDRQAQRFDITRIEEAFLSVVGKIDRADFNVDELRDIGAAVYALSVKVDGISGASNAGREDLMERIADALGALAAKLERPAGDLSAVTEAVIELSAKLDRAHPRDTGLEDLVSEVALRLDGIEHHLSKPASSVSEEGLANLELAVRELNARLGEARSVDQGLQIIEEKLDDLADARVSHETTEQTAQAIARALGDRIAGADPEALLGHVLDIHERLDAIVAGRQTPTALEDTLRDLADEFESFKATRDAVSRSATTLSEMRAEQAQLDRRLDDRFAGLQDVLERLVERIGAVDAASPGLPRERPFAPERSRPDLQDIPDRVTSEPAPRPSAAAFIETAAPAPSRSRESAESAKMSAANAHIAAARRAANAAAAEIDRRDEKEPSKYAGAANSFAQRALGLVSQHRRPVLLGAAGALALLTGAVYELRGQAPVRKSEIESVSPLAGADTQSGDSAVIDMAPTSAISPPKSAPGPLASPAPVPLRPAGALVAALPAGIGSALAAAASNGDAGAEVEIAQRFLEGRTVPRDPKAAAQWMQAAADGGNVFALYRLGALYEKGVGLTRDAAMARELYQKAAEGGNSRAMHNLAVLFAEDGGAGKPDYAAAVTWFEKAASYGVRDSQFNLGVLYGRGLGSGQDLARSWMWFSAAARQGDADAARKRDEVANRMDGRAMEAAQKLLDGFKPLTADPAVNDPPAPPAAAAAIPSKMSSGVKG